ncbi:hypothetical protein Droror1_Dr00018118 [Drosera rotundifolia]
MYWRQRYGVEHSFLITKSKGKVDLYLSSSRFWIAAVLKVISWSKSSSLAVDPKACGVLFLKRRVTAAGLRDKRVVVVVAACVNEILFWGNVAVNGTDAKVENNFLL